MTKNDIIKRRSSLLAQVRKLCRYRGSEYESINALARDNMLELAKRIRRDNRMLMEGKWTH